MGRIEVNDSVAFDTDGGTLVGWRLVSGQGSGGPSQFHKPSPVLGATVSASTTQLRDLIDEANVSRSAFDTEIATSPADSWYSNLPSADQDNIFTTVRDFDCP